MKICQNNNCQKEFNPTSNSKGLFCSKSCAAIVNNTKFPKRKRNSITCLQCKKELSIGQIKYCSIKCQHKYINIKKIIAWQNGSFNASTKDGSISQTIRNYLLEINDNKCSKQSCRWGIENPFINKVILTIDHIDGNIYNGFVDNIELLCWNCHTLTKTFGSLNRGNGKRNTIGMRQYNKSGLTEN